MNLNFGPVDQSAASHQPASQSTTHITPFLKWVLVEVWCTKTIDSGYYPFLCPNFKIVIFQRIQWPNCEIIEVKRGHLVKRWEFGETKKNLIINFSKVKYVLSWPKVNFCLKVAQIWYLWFEIQGFEVTVLQPQTLASWTRSLKFELLYTEIDQRS